LTGKLKMPDGWLTGIISLAGVPDGGPQEIVSPSGLLILFLCQLTHREKPPGKQNHMKTSPQDKCLYRKGL
jgi:hypothetical protein